MNFFSLPVAGPIWKKTGTKFTNKTFFDFKRGSTFKRGNTLLFIFSTKKKKKKNSEDILNSRIFGNNSGREILTQVVNISERRHFLRFFFFFFFLLVLFLFFFLLRTVENVNGTQWSHDGTSGRCVSHKIRTLICDQDEGWYLSKIVMSIKRELKFHCTFQLSINSAAVVVTFYDHWEEQSLTWPKTLPNVSRKKSIDRESLDIDPLAHNCSQIITAL